MIYFNTGPPASQLLWSWTSEINQNIRGFAACLLLSQIPIQLAGNHEVRVSDRTHLHSSISHRHSLTWLLLWAGDAEPDHWNQALLALESYCGSNSRFIMQPDCWVGYLRGSVEKSSFGETMKVQWVIEHVVSRAPSGEHLEQQYPKAVDIPKSRDRSTLTILCSVIQISDIILFRQWIQYTCREGNNMSTSFCYLERHNQWSPSVQWSWLNLAEFC